MPDPYRSIVLFGAPGTGKGTQGKKLGEIDGFVHLATGDIFRNLDTNSDVGKQFLHYSSQGELVPDELTMEIWQNHVASLINRKQYDPGRDVLLLDGMPRSVPQAEVLERIIHPLAVVHLVASDVDAMVQRMKLRAEKEGRPDDADEKVIRNRFDVYKRETAPVLETFDPSLIMEIDAVGTIDEVFGRVTAAVKPIYDAEFAGV